METITLGQLLEAVHGTLLGSFDDPNAPITGVDTDSRSIHPGALFIPLAGERFDGHAYIGPALEAGAAGCLTAGERDSYLPGKFYVKVENPQRALRDLAAWYRGRFDIPFVGVTGSVGKTTAKDMLAAVLGTKYKVLKTEGNHNNTIGLPLTLLELDASHQIAVLEMGMDRPGEIDYLAGAVRPDVGVITNIGDAHIERLGSRENILKAKCEMLPHIRRDGLVVLNGDDPLLNSLRGKTPVPAVYCGQGEGCDFRAQVTGGDGVSHIHCRLTTPRMDREVKIPALGEHMIYPTLIAVAVGERFGLTPDQIEEGIGQFVPTRMRMNILHRGEGITILDDTYNANPQSMRAAVSVLADSQGSYKTAILGDMLELGPFAPALHSGVGECLGTAHIDCLLAVGQLAEHIAQGARDSGVSQVIHCNTREEAKGVLPRVIRPDSTILVKASRGMKLEELTAKLLELTEEA
ncbi:UDP-N-acetylmuramoyl-tripeptide--D-alanyl-D-alanine ligase [Colidextribacter sp. OB.20]|uniref:UDP-N-acetylmuramoyl-tripeptide--D-alanyl-D- alanine ligase n=1 Tax=Colidextribacter sp. OB.20 TaxID=2304568 RepID=UPI00136CE2E6|nr:UDP-N-acetylmuramoyl-tripeptide--D-alanyl-D-alanine ligase [Colidextribacter sp. OB.20]NBI09411.1 UDP-N-acetylmuramoyl-tripeptide--D-alanyl-D-alanine ligase [Colidextribacter sp. OB.20]